METPLLEVRDLIKHFPVKRSWLARARHAPQRVLRAVDGVSLHVAAGETLGLVGESGCGKTTLGLAILGLVSSSGGQILFEGTDVTQPSSALERRLRRHMQIIYQDPFSSLDPRQRVEDIIREPLDIHGVGSASARRRRVQQLMDLVALPRRQARRYPHELSGGLRQRVGIATALALSPKLIIADEPTSALDASVQAEILNLLTDLQRETGVAYIFISHNLDVVRHISHRVAVMYLGKIVETGPGWRILSEPHHPYTRVLLASIPIPNPTVEQEPADVRGDVPSPIDVPLGCAFHPRCALRTDICYTVIPPLFEYEPEHSASCHVTAAEYRLRSKAVQRGTRMQANSRDNDASVC